ncbi:MAG TPA: ABC transporter permease [Streptosporangiaceae bacterium]|nr:ABC transporter permease [Streptosporangiaceae bacterium]
MTTLTGTGALTKLAFRRDRVMLVIWIYVLTAFVAFTVYGFKGLYPTTAERIQFAATVGHNPALLSLYGPMFGNTLGSLTAWRDAALGGVGTGLMSIFIVIRHTRADEETGRLELVGSAVVGRHAALVTALLVSCGANIMIGVLMAAAVIALGLPAAGSIAMAAGFAGCGLAFTGVAAITAQVAQTARSARGIATGVLGVAFLLRAVGDSASASGLRWLSWLSPMGWDELNRAFGSIRWWVLVLPLATAVVLATTGALLAVHRDYDAGVLPQRPGPAAGRAWLRSPLALAWRLQRSSTIAWVTGALIYGLVIGSSAKGIDGLLRSSQVRQIVVRLGGQAGISNAYLAAILSFTGLIAAGYAVSAILRLRSEETDGLADPILATGASRTAWGLSQQAIAAAGTVVILVATGLGAGLGYGYRSGGGGAEVARLAGAGLAQAPAALVIGGIAGALFGLAPKASVAGSWSALGVAVLMLLVGATLQLPHWVLDVSPFQHLPKLPGGPVSVAPLVWLSLIALALGVVGLAGLRRRDIA